MQINLSKTAWMAAFVIAIFSLKVSAQDFSNFTVIENLQNVTEIDIGQDICICNPGSGGPREAISVLWTIEPTNETNTTISSTPPNLVTSFFDDGELTFNFTAVAYQDTTSPRGVRIQVPRSQLVEVSVGGQQTAQILSGFTNLLDLEASEQSTLIATVQSVQSISAEEQATVHLDTMGNPVSVDLSNQSGTTLLGNVSGGTIENQASLLVRGTVEALTASDRSSVAVDGTIVSLTANGQAQVRVTDRAECQKVQLNSARASCSGGISAVQNASVPVYDPPTLSRHHLRGLHCIN